MPQTITIKKDKRPKHRLIIERDISFAQLKDDHDTNEAIRRYYYSSSAKSVHYDLFPVVFRKNENVCIVNTSQKQKIINLFYFLARKNHQRDDKVVQAVTELLKKEQIGTDSDRFVIVVPNWIYESDVFDDRQGIGKDSDNSSRGAVEPTKSSRPYPHRQHPDPVATDVKSKSKNSIKSKTISIVSRSTSATPVTSSQPAASTIRSTTVTLKSKCKKISITFDYYGLVLYKSKGNELPISHTSSSSCSGNETTCPRDLHKYEHDELKKFKKVRGSHSRHASKSDVGDSSDDSEINSEEDEIKYQIHLFAVFIKIPSIKVNDAPVAFPEHRAFVTLVLFQHNIHCLWLIPERVPVPVTTASTSIVMQTVLTTSTTANTLSNARGADKIDPITNILQLTTLLKKIIRKGAHKYIVVGQYLPVTLPADQDPDSSPDTANTRSSNSKVSQEYSYYQQIFKNAYKRSRTRYLKSW